MKVKTWFCMLMKYTTKIHILLTNFCGFHLRLVISSYENLAVRIISLTVCGRD